MQSQDLMRLAIEIFAGGLAFVAFSALIFWPLEEIFEGEKPVRPKLKDLAYLWFYQSYGLWIAAGFVFEVDYLFSQLMPLSWTTFVHRLPSWLQATAALLLAE